MVFKDAHAGVQHFRVQGLRSPRRGAVIGAPLQQQRDLDAARGGALERVAEGLPRVEIRRDQQHRTPRAVDRAHVGVLDRTPVQQVVAHDQRGAHGRRRAGATLLRWRRRAPCRRVEQLGEIASTHRSAAQQIRARRMRQLATHAAGGRGAQPQSAHARAHLGHRRAAQRHRVIQPRLRAPAVVQVEAVVDQVDAADEGLATVDHAQLAVQPPPVAALHQIEPVLPRAVDHELDAAVVEGRAQGRDRAVRAEPVDQHAYPHAAPRRVDQRLRQRARDRIVVKDVGLEPDLAARRGPGAQQRRKQRLAQRQQLDAIAADPGHAARRAPRQRRAQPPPPTRAARRMRTVRSSRHATRTRKRCPHCARRPYRRGGSGAMRRRLSPAASRAAGRPAAARGPTAAPSSSPSPARHDGR